MNTPLSMGSMFSNIITNPASVFDSIKLKNSFMAPLIALLLSTVIILVIYYSQIDPIWFVDYVISITPQDLAPDQIEQMKKFIKPETMKIFAPIMATIVTVVMILIQATVLNLAGKTTETDTSYGEWFALVCWTAVPQILVSIMIIINLSIGDNSQLRPDLLNPINMTSLFDLGSTGYFNKFMSFISVVTVWSIYLMATGYKSWTKSSTTAAYLITLLSFAVVMLIQVFLF